jgi:hypothetical protein
VAGFSTPLDLSLAVIEEYSGIDAPVILIGDIGPASGEDRARREILVHA